MATVNISGEKCPLTLQRGAVVAGDWDDNSEIGRSLRSPKALYCSETFARFDVSEIKDEITSVSFMLACEEAGSQETPAAASIFVQDRTDHSVWDDEDRAPLFDDFSATAWSDPLDSVSVQTAQTYTFRDYDGRLLKLVKDWVSGEKDWRDGVVIVAGFDDESAYLTTSRVMLVLNTDVQRKVSGEVRNSNGTLLKPVIVRAYDRYLGQEQVLGEYTIADDATTGDYSIVYSKDDQFDPKQPAANLVVKAIDAENGTTWVTSDLIENASADQVVNIYKPSEEAADKDTEFTTISGIVAPLVEDVGYSGLDDSDGRVVARREGVSADAVCSFISAMQLRTDEGLEAEFLYGLFRFKQTRDLAALVAVNEDDLLNTIKAAVAKNVIDSSYQLEDNFYTQLARLRSAVASSIPTADTGDATLLNELMTHVGVGGNENVASMLSVHYASDPSDTETFWSDVDTTFGSTEKVALAKIFELSEVAGHHTALTTQLYDHADVTEPRNLADLDETTVVQPLLVTYGVPYDTLGDTPEEKVENFLETFNREIERRYPSRRLCRKLPSEVGNEFEALRTFVDEQPEFNIATDNLDDYIAAQTTTPEVSDTLRRQIHQLQALYRTIPTKTQSDTVATLWNASYKSPYHIVQAGKSAFVSDVVNNHGIEEGVSLNIFNAAVAGLSTTLAYISAAGVGGTAPKIVLDTEDESSGGGDSSLESLFGSQDSCYIEHCASVFGPAAYLVDSFEYLKRTVGLDSGSPDGDNGLDKLEARRPDLTGINLTCKNTNTVMPYTDLVNELLQYAVAGAPIPSGADTLQTDGEAEDLAALPEHLHPTYPDGTEDPYDTLRRKIYPWNFDLYFQEAEQYLSAAGVHKYQLVKALRSDAEAIDLACEALGITNNTYSTEGDVWGERGVLAPDTLDPPPTLELAHTYGAGATLDILQGISGGLGELVKRSTRDYDALVELLESTFVNPSATPIVFSDGDPLSSTACALSTATLAFTEEEFQKLYRMRILVRKTGWSVETLDALLEGSLTKETLINLGIVKRLELERSIKAEYVAEAMGNEKAGRALVRKAVNISDEEVDAWATVLGYTLTNPFGDVTIEAFLEKLLAFREANLDAEQVAYLLGTYDDYENVPDEDELIELLKDLKEIITSAQDTVYTAEKTTFLDAAVDQAESDLETKRGELAEATDEEVIAALREQIAALEVSISEWNATIEELSGRYTEGTNEEVLTFLLTSQFTDEDLEEKDELVAEAVRIVTAGTIPTSDDLSFIEEHFWRFADPADAVTALNTASATDKYEYVRLRIFESFMAEHLATKYRLDEQVARTLLARNLTVTVSGVGGTMPAIGLFSKKSLDSGGNEIEGTIRGDYYLGLDHADILVALEELSSKLFPLGELSQAYGIDVEFFGYMGDQGFALEGFTLADLDALNQVADLRDAFEGRGENVFELFGLESFEFTVGDTACVLVADALDIAEVDVATLANSLSLPGSLAPHVWLDGFRDAAEVMRALDMEEGDAVKATAWATSFDTVDDARLVGIHVYTEDIRLHVAALNEDDWEEVGAEIREPLRAAQRDIMERYLIANGIDGEDMVDRNALYEHFLVDPGMEPCTMTSRLKLAISSTQLFTQRAILGFEPTVSIDSELGKEWKWRKNYRVWEANRKVFLYPENWIEPELRDDKTHLFEALENELLQGEVNEENVEKAYVNYLNGLRAISHMEVVGLYKEYYPEKLITKAVGGGLLQTNENEKVFAYTQVDDFILHVIARTHEHPHKNYYRKLEDGAWTAWEPVEVDIESEQVTPIVYNRRLYLLWPVFVEKSHKVDDDNEYKYFEVQLKYSTYENGAWTPPVLSSQKIDTLSFSKFIDGQVYADQYEDKHDELSELIDDLLKELGDRFGSLIKLPFLSDEGAETLFTNVIDRAREVADNWKVEIKKTCKEELLVQLSEDVADTIKVLYYGLVVVKQVSESDLNFVENKITTFKSETAQIAANVNDIAMDNGSFRDELDDKNRYIFKALVDPDSNQLKVFVGLASSTLVEQAIASVEVDDQLESLNSALSELGSSVGTAWLAGVFTLNGCTGNVMVDDAENGSSVYMPFIYTRPKDTELKSMKYCRTLVGSNPDKLRLYTKRGNANFLSPMEYLKSLLTVENYREQLLFKEVPRPCAISVPQQDLFFLGESPFVFQDSKKSFLAIPRERYLPTIRVTDIQQLAKPISKMRMDLVNKGMTAATFSASLLENGLARPTGSSASRSASSEILTVEMSTATLVAAGVSKMSLGTTAAAISNSLAAAVATDAFGSMPSTTDLRRYKPEIWSGKLFDFYTFYHPYTCLFIQQVNRYGIEGILSPGKGAANDSYDRYLVRQGADDTYFFGKSALEEYDPYTQTVSDDGAVADIDFRNMSPYGIYNWEIFFHAPLMIATRLTQNGKYEEAMKWFHYIFDPTADDKEAPQVYWRTRPFYEHSQRIGEDVIQFLDDTDDYEVLLRQWWKNPFNPHLIARFRKVAYMKNVVMKYLDNLIAWGDMLFRRDTIESLNEAAQLYVLAAQILGRKPILVSRDDLGEQGSYSDLMDELSATPPVDGLVINLDGELDEQITILHSLLYFGGVPQNDNLLEYWSTVSDRLFKIRNSMNIDGVVRTLDLFAPPIDPALLVRAAAAGLDFGSVLNDLASPAPTYKYRTLVQKATEFVGDVKTLGGALLSALEKKDAEELALLRSTHEAAVLEATLELKKQALEEAEASLVALESSKANSEARISYYEGLIDTGLLPQEKANQKHLARANMENYSAGSIETMASVVALIPDVKTGWDAGTIFGGSFISGAYRAIASGYRNAAADSSYQANRSSIEASNARRKKDWEFQLTLAEKDLAQIEKQIIASEVRVAMAENDVAATKKQIDNAEEAYAFLSDKYSNVQLYSWMVGQISSVYYQAYQLAYDTARKAEKAYKAELLDDDTSYIKFDNWDSLHKGLLAGERLHNDIKRLEAAFLEKNKRRYEVTKNISLALIAPAALAALRSGGYCEFSIPEALYDIDYPGQYQRRIRSVSLSIPCVAGPNTSVAAKLTMTKDTIRMKPNTDDGGVGVLKQDFGGIQSVATSQGVNDSGVFELSFNDERFLPFEGAGAVGDWQISLPTTLPPFDYLTISDVIMTIRYTAKEDAVFRGEVETALIGNVNTSGFGTLISMKSAFPAELETLVTEAVTADINLDLTSFLPGFMQSGATASIATVDILKVDENGMDDAGSVVGATPLSSGCILGIHNNGTACTDFDDLILNVTFSVA